MVKKCRIEYKKGEFHRASEKLMIYIPTFFGYIRYDVHYSVVKEINCDCWRIEDFYHCDDELNEIKCLSAKGEWECAVRLEGRPDFSGGTAHGDEIFRDADSVVLEVDIDKEIEITLEPMDVVVLEGVCSAGGRKKDKAETDTDEDDEKPAKKKKKGQKKKKSRK